MAFESGAFTIINVIGKTLVVNMYNVKDNKAHDFACVQNLIIEDDNLLRQTAIDICSMASDSNNVWIEASNKISIPFIVRYVLYSAVKQRRKDGEYKWFVILPNWMEDEFKEIFELIPDPYSADDNKMRAQLQKCIKLLA